MRKMEKKTIYIGATIAVIGIVVLAAVMAGGIVKIGGNNPGEQVSISITGSTTVLPIAQKAAEDYMNDHPNWDIQVSGGGSSVGVKSAGEGTVDIGMASRDMKQSEKDSYPDLKEIVVAKDGIAMIVHPDNPVSNLTVEQIRGIYNGTYTNWNQVGGNDQEIVVVGRDEASGTREFFWDHVMHKEDFVSTILAKNSNGAVKQTVEQTPAAIGFVGMGYIDTTVKALKINVDGTLIYPTVDNVIAGTYPISRSLHLLVLEANYNGHIKEFIDYVLSPAGQQIVAEEGFVPLS